MTHYMMYAAPWYADYESRARETAEDVELLETETADAPTPDTEHAGAH